MRRLAAGELFSRYAVAWCYLAGVTVAGVTCLLLPSGAQAAVMRFASTNVHNLHADPVGCLVVSAFFPSGSVGAWPLLIALAMFGANRALGNWRILVVCLAGHVIGTLVSEGILGYRVDHGTMPASARFIIDVGPSYVVVAAIAVAVLFGTWPARVAAAADLAVLVLAGGIFSGLTGLGVTPVGHAMALVTGAVAGALAWWQLRARQRRRAGRPGGEAQAGSGRRVADQAAQPRPPA
jgi:hypothetical protein